MRLNDLILFAVVFGSMGAAVMFPVAGEAFQPFLLYFMMLLLFLSFLRIDFRAFLDTSPSSLFRLAVMTAVKLLILPAALYYLSLAIIPEYAIPVLLLSGISTGVVAPFIATLVAADVAGVLRMVVATSLVVPFSLPSLVKVLAGAEIRIPLTTMVELLAVVVFVPITAVVILRRCLPSALQVLAERQFPVSLVLFAMINLGVFSKYSSFFFNHPGSILLSIALAYVLSAIYFITGVLMTPGLNLNERVAAGVSLALMNNVLVIVFSSRFFGPLSPTLAAMYMFPFFTMIVPVKLIASRMQQK
ncbi:MAG: bile acid:sodium symporter [Desulfomonile tiedjei]|uniref:Bile acid:sodium symporter n=1 Tax=Desulfomonile tiedjei TaxID=2358 RepID=A0A9D6V242_9BACT|nr:bile acid:sodium symporter [Desulfomonile tiedjei]